MKICLVVFATFGPSLLREDAKNIQRGGGVQNIFSDSKGVRT